MMGGIYRPPTGGGGGGGAVSSVVGQTGDVTGTQILADTAVTSALAAKADTSTLGTAATHAASDFDASGAAASAQSAAIAASAQAWTTTTTKTVDYPANVGELVPVDTTGGNVTVTLPATPAAGKRVAVRRSSAGANTLTVQRASTDTIAVGTGTATSITLTLQDRVVVLTSDGAGHWTPTEGFQALAATDSRYLQSSNNLSDVTAATARTNLGINLTADRIRNILIGG